MANQFLSETSAGVGTSEVSLYTCPADTETTIIGLSLTNVAPGPVDASAILDCSGRTSGAEDSVYLVKGATIPQGSSLAIVGGDQKVVMEPGDVLKVVSNTDSSIDVVLSHLDIV
jgi:hypothetical protein